MQAVDNRSIMINQASFDALKGHEKPVLMRFAKWIDAQYIACHFENCPLGERFFTLISSCTDEGTVDRIKKMSQDKMFTLTTSNRYGVSLPYVALQQQFHYFTSLNHFSPKEQTVKVTLSKEGTDVIACFIRKQEWKLKNLQMLDELLKIADFWQGKDFVKQVKLKVVDYLAEVTHEAEFDASLIEGHEQIFITKHLANRSIKICKDEYNPFKQHGRGALEEKIWQTCYLEVAEIEKMGRNAPENLIRFLSRYLPRLPVLIREGTDLFPLILAPKALHNIILNFSFLSTSVQLLKELYHFFPASGIETRDLQISETDFYSLALGRIVNPFSERSLDKPLDLAIERLFARNETADFDEATAKLLLDLCRGAYFRYKPPIEPIFLGALKKSPDSLFLHLFLGAYYQPNYQRQHFLKENQEKSIYHFSRAVALSPGDKMVAEEFILAKTARLWQLERDDPSNTPRNVTPDDFLRSGNFALKFDEMKELEQLLLDTYHANPASRVCIGKLLYYYLQLAHYPEIERQDALDYLAQAAKFAELALQFNPTFRDELVTILQRRVVLFLQTENEQEAFNAFKSAQKWQLEMADPYPFLTGGQFACSPAQVEEELLERLYKNFPEVTDRINGLARSVRRAS